MVLSLFKLNVFETLLLTRILESFMVPQMRPKPAPTHFGKHYSAAPFNKLSNNGDYHKWLPKFRVAAKIANIICVIDLLLLEIVHILMIKLSLPSRNTHVASSD